MFLAPIISRKYRKRRRYEIDEDEKVSTQTLSEMRGKSTYDFGKAQKELQAVKCYIRVLLDIHTDDIELDRESDELREWLKLCLYEVDVRRRRFELQMLATTKVFGIIRECVHSFAWNDVFRALKTFSNHPVEYHKLSFFRVVLEVYHRTLSRYGQLSALVSSLNHITCLCRKQICVDHCLMRLVTLSSNFQLVEVFRDLDNSLVAGGNDIHGMKKTKRDKITDNILYLGYRAVLLYIRFIKSRQEYSSTAVAAMTGTEQLAQLLNHHLQSALTAFQEFEVNIRKEPGCWDIFISKYIELLNIQDTDKSREMAEAILKRYAAQNSLNPNAWRFLYSFYTLHSYPIEDHINVLRELCECVPSDTLTVELYKLSLHGKDLYGQEYDPVPLFFNHLDYNMGSKTTWEIMAALFVVQSSRFEDTANYEKFTESVKDCWVNQNRNTWWPSFQFALPSLLPDTEGEEYEVLLFKAVVARFLLGIKNSFTVAMKDSLSRTKIKSEAKSLLKMAKGLPTFAWT